jgi:DNA-binding MarR family transcriptional regulator
MTALGPAGIPSGAALPAHLVPYLLNRAVGSFNRAWLEHLREHGVTVARWQVLAILAQLDGARPGQIAEMAVAEQSVMSRVLDQMVRDGLVRRRPARDDGRAVEVWLTPKGRRTFESLLPEAEGVVATALGGLDPATTDALMHALTTMAANLDAAPVLPTGLVATDEEARS